MPQSTSLNFSLIRVHLATALTYCTIDMPLAVMALGT